ncbi:deoxyribose-phosphate aldolase [Paenibacillus lautus]|uniref:deoxyribose-phosphate aldolase n=1 Tax=Paenibacillus lautus TaxID=1401 RepID=UPI000FDBE8E2|nr:deoxyribose-phosphate aldolase [Paenibacillus lautus]
MNIAGMIDHTLLKADATQAEITKITEEAKKYEFASVCVNPTWVSYCAEQLADTNVKVCTVIGFPLGAATSTVKAFEAKDAIANGAAEVDMVINIGALKDRNDELVLNDIQAVVDAATPEDVALMRKTVGENIGVKASGGVRSKEDMDRMIEAGATRIGASSGVKIMEGGQSSSSY